MDQAGYKFSESQLDRWVARINAGETAVSTSFAEGASVHLTREQRSKSRWLGLITEFAWYSCSPIRLP
jgi:hypothetical protein